MTRTVFISHSAEDDPKLTDAQRKTRERARDVRDEIERGLTEVDGLTAWIDREQLEAGQEWRKEIHAALFNCAAGVILLDDEAFNSPWVLKETTVLSVRRSLLPTFPMVPVLLDQGSSAQFEKRPEWKALGMREIQAMKKPPEEVAAAVIDLIKDAAVPEPTSFELWVDDIFGILHAFGPQKVRLDKIAKDLQVPAAADWTADDRRAVRTLALALATSRDPIQVVRVVRELASLAPDSRVEIKRLLMPAWVRPERAALAAAGLRSTEFGRRLILGSEDEHVAHEHLNRAECCSNDLRVCGAAIAQGEDENGDLLYDSCAASIWAAFPMANGKTGPQFAACLAQYHNPPVVLRVAPGAMQGAVLRSVVDRVQSDFAGVAVLMMTDDVASLAAELAPPMPLALIPALTSDEIGTRSGYEAELDLFVKGKN
jgi:TIR domain